MQMPKERGHVIQLHNRLAARALPLTCAVALLFALTGCHHKPKPLAGSGVDTAPATANLPAPTASITADPQAIDLGQSVVLNWRTTDATSVQIDGIGPVAVNGTQTVSPSNSTNFHLVAKGDGGTTEANVRVTVRVPQVPSATGNATGTAGAGDMGTDAELHAHVQDLFFDYDSYEIRPADTTSIAAAAQYLNAHPAIRLVIGGYCDDRGSAEYNLTLGENRADAAKNALVNAGVSASRLRVVSYGKERQFCTEETDQCWQENRRAQFTLDR